MTFIPEDELKGRGGLNLAPMIDFLFLMLMFFASLALSRISTKDTNITLVENKPETAASTSDSDRDSKIIHISINATGEYKWVTEIYEYPMKHPEDITTELKTQYEKGILAENKEKTKVLLKIDKKATWEPILKAIFAIREAGFDARPVYEPENEVKI